ncbi:MAG: DUF853 family protein, partial [Phenylobacterium sp.]|nr:DUF853 family protein [Phenylobacterium sp.]
GLKAAADSFRTNPAFDTAEAIQALGVGEALVSVLDEKGAPTMVQKTLIRPPASRLGPLTPAERAAVMAASPVRGLYDEAQDRDSAFEKLAARATAAAEAAAAPPVQTRRAEPTAPWGDEPPPARRPAARASNRQSMGETFAKQLLRTVASTAGREIMRGLMGGLKRSRR